MQETGDDDGCLHSMVMGQEVLSAPYVWAYVCACVQEGEKERKREGERRNLWLVILSSKEIQA